jgi:cytoskeletal protein CcmA (bactofilin family)
MMSVTPRVEEARTRWRAWPLESWRAWWRAVVRRLAYHSRAHAPSGPQTLAPRATPLLATRTQPHDGERTQLLIRKESKADSFQRQISALRQQLGGQDDDPPPFDDAEAMPEEDLAAVGAPPDAARTINYAVRPAPLAMDWPAVDAETGVIAAGSRWHGQVHANGSLHIYGEAEGELTAEHDIWVATGANVDATLRATNLIVAGTVGGTIVCGGRLEVRPGGQVSGDVSAPSLVVHDGATLTGTLRMQGAAASAQAERG